MKKLILLAVIVFASSAQAFELMKCTSQKHGTLWASFGTLWKSGATEGIPFPTEIGVFGQDYAAKNVYYDTTKALQIPLRLTDRVFALEFETVTNGVTRSHVLQVFAYDSALKDSLVGNWNVRVGNGEPIYDDVACTRH